MGVLGGGGEKAFPDQQRSSYMLALEPPPPLPTPGDALMHLLIRAEPRMSKK